MDFEKIFKEIKSELLNLLKENYSEYKTESKKDIDLFLNDSKERIKKWTELLADGSLSLEDYEWLLKGQKDLLKMQSLYMAGISKIRIGHLKNRIIKTIINVIKIAVL